ncbi:glycine-rich domain-containing protein [Azonexus sp. IMCC34842]|uniref:glycine-rich domain-containing protein n=1 Tax=Azonexus sp. IMCC34842 TaxID=3420950 RepID=UPI003D14B69F
MIKLFIAGALFLAVFLVWQKWRRAGQARHIEHYPYQRVVDQRLAARRPELSAEQRGEVLAGLVDYFQICRKAGRRMVAMPSQAVDDAWHEFILSTRLYDKFCRHAFGRFLHHTPAAAMQSPTQADDGIRRAWRLACAHEGIDPKQPDRLPRLFALDARLALAGGFIYQLDCLASGMTGRAYCASHIGCSSGCSGDSGGADSSDAGGDGGGGCGGD